MNCILKHLGGGEDADWEDTAPQGLWKLESVQLQQMSSEMDLS